MLLIVPKTKPLSFGIKDWTYTLFRTLPSFYFLKLTLSEKRATVFIKTVDYFKKTVDYFSKRVDCFDKKGQVFQQKGDVSILTHPLHNPLL